MLYPEILEEARRHVDQGNPELAEFADRALLKANILGHFPHTLKHSYALLDWIMYTSYIVHPTAIVASFLTILSGLTARGVYTHTGISTPLFTIAIAPTGSGKDIVTDVPRKVFDLYPRDNFTCMQSKISSEGALDDIFRKLLKASDFVLINGVWEAKRDGLIKILSSLPISYEWRLTKTDVRDTYAKIEGRLTVNVGELVRSSSGLGICEMNELRGNGGLHFCSARAETRALKRAIEVLFGSVINYFVLNFLHDKAA